LLDIGLTAMENNIPKGRILTCNVDGSGMKTLVEGLGSAPDGLAFDPENRQIYYTNMGVPSIDNGFISRINADGGQQTVVIEQGITWTPKQMTLDLTSRKLYWCDREGMRVFRSNLDGSMIEVLVRTGEGDEARKDMRNWCVGIAVDPKRKLIYWTQKGPSKGFQGRLFCAGMDIPNGETPDNRTDKRLLLDHLPEPIDLDLDVEENVMYMSDRGDPPYGNTINKIDLKDHEKVTKTILIKKLHEAIGLTLDLKNRRMFMTDLLGSLYSANMDGSDEKVLFPDLGELTGIICIHQ